MQPTDGTPFRALLAGVFAFYGKDLSDFAIGVWWEAMKPYDLGAVRDAMNRHAVNPDNGQFLPKPADVVKLIGGGTQDAALVAWAKVTNALRVVGRYKSVAFDDPLIHAVVSDMGGWIPLGDVKEDELPFRGKEFENRYRGYRLRSAVPPYPAKLLGIMDRENASRGFMPSEPVLIGDPGKARTVLQGGGSGALQITQHVERALEDLTQ